MGFWYLNVTVFHKKLLDLGSVRSKIKGLYVTASKSFKGLKIVQNYKKMEENFLILSCDGPGEGDIFQAVPCGGITLFISKVIAAQHNEKMRTRDNPPPESAPV